MNIGSDTDTTSSLRFSLKKSFMSTVARLDPLNSPFRLSCRKWKTDLEKECWVERWLVVGGWTWVFSRLTKVCGLGLYEFSSFTKAWIDLKRVPHFFCADPFARRLNL